MPGTERQMTVTAVRDDKALFLCMEVMSGEFRGEKFEVTTTLGVSGAALLVRMAGAQEVLDLRPLVQEWVEALGRELDLETKTKEMT